MSQGFHSKVRHRHQIISGFLQWYHWATDTVLLDNNDSESDEKRDEKAGAVVIVQPLLRWLRQKETTTPRELTDPSINCESVTEHLRLAYITCTANLPCLMSLDLRKCNEATIDDAAIHSIAQFHPRLRRLHLVGSSVTQSCLAAFRHLEELGISYCRNISSVGFCVGTQKVLWASGSSIDDEGLRNAVHLEVLHVQHCSGVTTVAPFAATLRELDASLYCGIGDAGLVHATNLVSLDISYNQKVTTLLPFCRTLRKLNVRDGKVDDAAMALATNLVILDGSSNGRITIIPPSVRELAAQGRSSGVDNDAVHSATQLMKLDVAGNEGVTSLGPCLSASLRWLSCSIGSLVEGDAKSSSCCSLVRLKSVVYDGDDDL